MVINMALNLAMRSHLQTHALFVQHHSIAELGSEDKGMIDFECSAAPSLFHPKNESNLHQKLLEKEKEIVREVARGDEH